jgi:CheY-like chemotaxis protein
MYGPSKEARRVSEIGDDPANEKTGPPNAAQKIMRTIGGDLGLVSMAGLLQLLSGTQAKGFLTISKADQKKTILFGPDGIRLVSGVRRAHPLGQILIRSGRITPTQLDELLKEQQASRKRLGDLVAERGLLPQDTIEQALRDQVAEEIYDLFSWTDAKFYFVEGTSDSVPEGAGPLASVVLDANITSFMIEAARRSDEVERIRAVLPSDDLIVRRVELPVAFEDPAIDPDAALQILVLADGKRTVGKIAEESLYPKFTVLRTLYALVQRGVLKVRSRTDAETSTNLGPKAPDVMVTFAPAKGLTVLLVSALISFRNMLAWFLRKEGYTVIELGAWSEAGGLLPQLAVHAVILDVSIDTDDALTICQRVRTTTGIPFVVLSENASKKALTNALHSGAHCVLVKPVKEKLLVARLAELR